MYIRIYVDMYIYLSIHPSIHPSIYLYTCYVYIYICNVYVALLHQTWIATAIGPTVQCPLGCQHQHIECFCQVR